MLEGPTGLQRKVGQQGTCWEQEACEASDTVAGFSLFFLFWEGVLGLCWDPLKVVAPT